MAMVIKNNSAAQLVLGELNKNNNKLSKSLQKVSSGMKLNGAEDGASEYAISEKMRVRIRGLNQDIVNAQTGSNLVRVAEGGIQDIIDNLRDMKAMAIKSANDHNTDADRATIQKEFEQRKAEIDDIAATTNYNGRLLLLGDYKMPPDRIEEPNGSPTIISSGDYTISADGVYEFAPGYTGNVTITATNVKLTQSSTYLNNVYINCTNDNTNLWADGLRIQNDGTVDKSPLRFSGGGNILHIKKYTHQKPGTGFGVTQTISSALINVGQGLTIVGEKGEFTSLGISMANTAGLVIATGAGIGSDANEKSNANVVIHNVTELKVEAENGAGIGSGENGSIGSIYVDGLIDWGAGSTTKSRLLTTSIQIDGKNGAGIGTGVNGSCGDIYVSVGVLTLYNRASGNTGSALGTGRDGKVNGSIIVESAEAKFSANGAPAIGNYRNVSGKIKIGESEWYSDNEQYNSSIDIKRRYDDGEPEYTPLIIHTGTKANENLKVYINDMRTESMGLSNVKVIPREAAVAALSSIDDAVNYALDENTRMGAYQSRLKFTIDNLTTASENTQASESVIRDADMAKSMTEYTKSNALAQAAQSMLAQANQSSANVFSLLQ